MSYLVLEGGAPVLKQHNKYTALLIKHCLLELACVFTGISPVLYSLTTLYHTT